MKREMELRVKRKRRIFRSKVFLLFMMAGFCDFSLSYTLTLLLYSLSSLFWRLVVKMAEKRSGKNEFGSMLCVKGTRID